MRLEIAAASDFAPDAKTGDSICVKGVCLTVVEHGGGRLVFDVIRETLNRTTLGRLHAGDPVNLEASLKAGDRIGGHFVQGHVDGLATVTRVDAAPDHPVVWLRTPGPLGFYLNFKGSVAVDGVSLTIADVVKDEFSVALIPTTLAATTLGRLHEGDVVHIETDMIVRAVVNYLQRVTTAGLPDHAQKRRPGEIPSLELGRPVIAGKRGAM